MSDLMIFCELANNENERKNFEEKVKTNFDINKITDYYGSLKPVVNIFFTRAFIKNRLDIIKLMFELGYKFNEGDFLMLIIFGESSNIETFNYLVDKIPSIMTKKCYCGSLVKKINGKYVAGDGYIHLNNQRDSNFLNFLIQKYKQLGN